MFVSYSNAQGDVNDEDGKGLFFLMFPSGLNRVLRRHVVSWRRFGLRSGLEVLEAVGVCVCMYRGGVAGGGAPFPTNESSCQLSVRETQHKTLLRLQL